MKYTFLWDNDTDVFEIHCLFLSNLILNSTISSSSFLSIRILQYLVKKWKEFSTEFSADFIRNCLFEIELAGALTTRSC